MKDVFRPIAKILSGTAAAQALSLLLLPVISRIYLPEVYGEFGMTLAAISVISVAVTLQLQQAVIVADRDYAAYGSYALGRYLSYIGALATTILAVLYFCTYLNYKYSEALLLALACGLAVAYSCNAQLAQSLIVRNKMFGHIGISAILRVVVLSVIQIGGGLLTGESICLLFGYMLGELSVSTYLKFVLRKKHLEIKKYTIARFRVLLRSFKDIAIFGTAQEAMNSASQNIPVLLLGAYFGPAASGYYAFTMRILSAPIQLLGNSVRHVFSQRFSVIAKDLVGLTKEFRLSSLVLVFSSLIVASLVCPWLPEMFGYLFGDKWMPAGQYGQWLIFWIAFLLANIPATVVIRTLRRQKENFYLNILILALRVCCLVVGGFFLSSTNTVIAFALLGVVLNISYILFASHYLKIEKVAN